MLKEIKMGAEGDAGMASPQSKLVVTRRVPFLMRLTAAIPFGVGVCLEKSGKLEFIYNKEYLGCVGRYRSGSCIKLVTPTRRRLTAAHHGRKWL